ncbi:glycosyltransferase family 2 protein [Selenomonas sp.]|uniref:glycosyltransferase family 2 protein n=1 Tax=Selenomonas sp. TaxID=2053611 RepID=UPI0025E6C4B3|nr:glycosyltransferase family 2 protein [Selenomonas sp.]MCI6085211.1 glycosyltransferase family 2 protein [Selenomonas sp.]MDY3297566.1 glycosyltransferase family 2 protein [Selenomonas sp.]MDY4415352.1 glycosyltransferase family 2 protein [Selenomonas sp.]
MKKQITIVVPVYNEAENIPHFTQAVAEAMAPLPYDYTLLFVDDGSREDSRRVLRETVKNNPHVRAIYLSRNYGHQAALTCGIDNADGDAVITMDGDMQHPPALIPRLLALWEQGYDIVQTIRETTEGVSAFKRLSSKYYYKALNLISEVPIQPGGSDFRLMDREAVLALRQYREHDRFIRGIVGALGFRQVQVPFVAPERYAGTSKFSLKKMAKFALNGILGNSIVPLRISFYIGLLSLLFSVALFGHVIFEEFEGDTVPGWSTLVILAAFFGGTQLMVLGILGEYIGHIFREVKGRPLYLTQKERPLDESGRKDV